MNEKNLKPFNTWPADQHRAASVKGGIASGLTRRRRAARYAATQGNAGGQGGLHPLRILQPVSDTERGGMLAAYQHGTQRGAYTLEP